MQLVVCIKSDVRQSVSLENLQESKKYSFLTCKGDAPVKITAPENHVIYVERLAFGMTRDGSCGAYDPNYCSSDAVITCTLKSNAYNN